MHYFLLLKGREFVVYRVRDEHAAAFRAVHGGQVLLEADGLVPLLVLFEGEWLIGLEWPL